MFTWMAKMYILHLKAPLPKYKGFSKVTKSFSMDTTLYFPLTARKYSQPILFEVCQKDFPYKGSDSRSI